MERKHFTCMNCQKEFEGELSLDTLGWHTVCPFCGASFDVDAPDSRSMDIKNLIDVLDDLYKNILQCKDATVVAGTSDDTLFIRNVTASFDVNANEWLVSLVIE